MDFKKTQKDLYQPKTTPSIINVPKMLFISIDGKGDPNTSPEYTKAIEALYAVAYNIKMSNKAILEYVVPPLEGFWVVNDKNFTGETPVLDKSKFLWTMAIRQPDFVTSDIFESAKTVLAQKKPNISTTNINLQYITEGLCVQAMHIGSYDSEITTIQKLEQYAITNGYKQDITQNRHHHEIYISDPRKTAVEKLKTIIRHPIIES